MAQRVSHLSKDSLQSWMNYCTGLQGKGPMGWGILKVSVASNKPVHTKCCPTMSKANVFNCSECQLSKFGWKGCRHPGYIPLLPSTSLSQNSSLLCSVDHTNGDNGTHFQTVSPQGHSVSHSVICTKSDVKGFGVINKNSRDKLKPCFHTSTHLANPCMKWMWLLHCLF